MDRHTRDQAAAKAENQAKKQQLAVFGEIRKTALETARQIYDVEIRKLLQSGIIGVFDDINQVYMDFDEVEAAEEKLNRANRQEAN